MDPTSLGAGGREDLPQCSPEPQGAVAHGQHRRPHPPALEVPQQIGPALRRLPVAVLDGHQLLGPVSPHTHHDQRTQAFLLQAHVEVDAVDPHVDVVDAGEVSAGEGGPLVLPLLRQPGDDRGRQPGSRAEELGQGRGEVARRHPVEVHERQHLGHLGTLAAPRRDDGRAEPAALAGARVDPAIVDPWHLDLDGPGGGGDGAGLGMPVAHDQSVAVLVELADQGLDVAGGLGFDGGGQHPPGALPDDLIQRGSGIVRSGAVFGDYCQHRRVLPR